MRISDWSSDVCSSDLNYEFLFHNISKVLSYLGFNYPIYLSIIYLILNFLIIIFAVKLHGEIDGRKLFLLFGFFFLSNRSEEHTSELQSLMRISYAVFCLKK